MIKYNGKRGYYMFNTTLCYIEKDGAYLMIHRIKKENDLNKDKWVGVGGKLEEGESPFDCVRREVYEETGVIIKEPRYRGIITFVSDKWGTEYMHLFTATDYDGEIDYDCDEGKLEWIKKELVPSLPIWEGDKIFFDLMEKEERFFSLKLCYEGDTLVSHTLEF
jgi:8-oxo-dGTP diphosphatase